MDPRILSNEMYCTCFQKHMLYTYVYTHIVVTFNFERDEYNVTESDGSIQLCLVASHVSDVEINVTLQISNENPIGSGMGGCFLVNVVNVYTHQFYIM